MEQNFPSPQRMARVEDQPHDFPTPIVNQQIGDVADLAVARLHDATFEC
jgi:hypothetical protein